MMGHALRAAIATVAIAGALLIVTPAASAAGDHVRGKCGMHIGLVAVPVHPPLKPTRYHVRIGVPNGGSGGLFQCVGKHARAGRAGSLLTWQPFSFPRWNWHHVLSITKDSVFTAAGCASFATGIAAETPSLGLSTTLVLIGGGACADGIYNLGQLLPGTHNGPKAVRLVK